MMHNSNSALKQEEIRKTFVVFQSYFFNLESTFSQLQRQGWVADLAVLIWTNKNFIFCEAVQIF